jgi:hypothetical protein
MLRADRRGPLRTGSAPAIDKAKGLRFDLLYQANLTSWGAGRLPAAVADHRRGAT